MTPPPPALLALSSSTDGCASSQWVKVPAVYDASMTSSTLPDSIASAEAGPDGKASVIGQWKPCTAESLNSLHDKDAGQSGGSWSSRAGAACRSWVQLLRTKQALTALPCRCLFDLTCRLWQTKVQELKRHRRLVDSLAVLERLRGL